MQILKKIGFTGGDGDPCLFSKKDKNGVCYVGLYVDDNLIIGHPKAVEDTILKLKENNLILKVEDNLEDYLQCATKLSKDKKKECLDDKMLFCQQRETKQKRNS